jgi:hypothetical protein
MYASTRLIETSITVFPAVKLKRWTDLPTVTVPEEACLPVMKIEYFANGLIPLKLAGICVGKTAQKSVP